MLINFVKLSYRSLFRQKTYSFINITGLAVGMSACMLLTFWVKDELGFDQFHKNANEIYRVERRWDFKEMHGQAPIAAAPWGPALVEDYSEILSSVRIYREETFVRDPHNLGHRQKLIAADETLFDIFDFQLSDGDKKTALGQPFCVVITEELAQKYCGTTEALNQTITLDWQGKPTDFKVTGIMKSVPSNSHMQFEMVVSFLSYPSAQLTNWMAGGYFTFILLDKNTTAANVEAKLPDFLKKYATNDFITYFGSELDINKVFQIKLRPLSSIHLAPSRDFEFGPQGSQQLVYIFSLAAFAILLVACFNYVNLSTAQAYKRAKEVALRKASGANRQQLIIHYFLESLTVTMVAFILAAVFTILGLPYFNNLSGKLFSIETMTHPHNMLLFISLALVTGIMAGMYPAIYMSSFQPIKIFKGLSDRGTGKSAFRRTLTILQFSVSIALIIGAFIISGQLNYIQNKSLGFNKENVIIIPVQSQIVRENTESLRDALLNDPRIINISASSLVPGRATPFDTNFKLGDKEDVFNLLIMTVDYRFVNTYKLKIPFGRQFSKEHGMDKKSSFLLNQRAAQTLGVEPDQLVGKQLSMILDENTSQTGQIIGIADNFHLQSLHQKMQPMAIFMSSGEDIKYISIRINPGNIPETIRYIESGWKDIFPNEQFEYTFLDQRLNILYDSDRQTRTIFFVFTILTLFIAAIGLFAMASFTIRERTKEIGIRKVLGAPVSGLIVLLSGEFIRWILYANLIAWPMAYFVMSKWLQNFAFRIEMNLWIYIFAGIVALIIAILTISIQTGKTATANPVKALRYE